MLFEAELVFGKTYELNKHSVPAGDWIIEGYASTSDLDAQNHIVSPEAIKMGAESLLKYNTVLFNHDPDRPIGKIVKSEAQDTKLWMKVSISKTEPKLWEQVKDGTLSKFSIRGKILESEYYTDERSLVQKEILVIKAMELHEVSLVSVPANPEAKSLSWYIEKSIEKNKKALTEDDVIKIVVDAMSKGKKPEIDVQKNKNTFEAAISSLEAGLSVLKGEDKEQVESIIRTLQALIGRVYSKSLDEEKGGLLVETEVKKEQTEEKKDETKTEEVTKSETPVVEEKKVEEVKKTEATIDVAALTSVITQLQSMVKDANSSVEAVNKGVTEIAKAKDEVTKLLTDLNEAMKSIPVRKGAPAEPEEDRTKETITTKAITETEQFQKMRPDQQLHALIEQSIK